MLSTNLIRSTLLLATIFCCNLSIGCGGAQENQVVAPQQTDEELRAETERKLEQLKNVDEASL
jgi:hypothetical protein